MSNEEKWKQEFEEYIKKDIVFMNSYPERDTYLEACKKRQSEIERLEKELKKKDQIIEKAEKELQATREQLEKCEYSLMKVACFETHGENKYINHEQAYTGVANFARQYFQDKQKDEVSDESI